MRKAIVLAGWFVLLGGMTGCGASADSLVKEEIQAMNDLAGALETKAPEAKLKEAQQKVQDINKKLEALKLSDAEKNKLLERHRDELGKATTRLVQASMNQAFGKMGGGIGLPDPSKIPGFPVPAGSGDKK